MSKVFIEQALGRAKITDSKIIFAFDPSSNPYEFKRSGERLKEKVKIYSRAQHLLSVLEGEVVGIKLGWPAMFALGPDRLGEIINSFKGSYFFICDSKMADIGYTNRLVAKQIFELGFDALIIHAAIGARQGIDEVVDLAEKMGRGVLGLCAMSHPGAAEHLNKHFDTLLGIAVSAGVDGFILPATYPELITQARSICPSSIIASPGVGTQGAPVGSAISAGADFEIIGRTISRAQSPAEKAREIKEAMKKWM